MLDTYFRISKKLNFFFRNWSQSRFFNNFQLIKVLFTKFLCQAKIWWIIIRAMPRMSEKCYSHIFFLISIRPQMTFKVLFTISTELHWKLFFNWCIVFKNPQKCLIWIFEFSPYFCLIKSDLSGNTIYSKCHIWILALSTDFCLKKLTCLVTLFDCKVQIFKLTIFWYFLLIFVHSKWKVSGLQKLAKIDSFWHFQQTLDNEKWLVW